MLNLNLDGDEESKKNMLLIHQQALKLLINLSTSSKYQIQLGLVTENNNIFTVQKQIIKSVFKFLYNKCNNSYILNR